MSAANPPLEADKLIEWLKSHGTVSNEVKSKGWQSIYVNETNHWNLYVFDVVKLANDLNLYIRGLEREAKLAEFYDFCQRLSLADHHDFNQFWKNIRKSNSERLKQLQEEE